MEKKLYTPTFFVINIMNFIILTANGLFVLYPLRLQELGKAKWEIGFIIGIYSLAAILSRFLIGHYLDKIGRRFFVRLGVGLFMLCAVLYAAPVTGDFYLVCVRLLHGLAYGFYFTAVFTWIADYAPHGHMAEAIGVFGVSGLLTSATGPVVGEYVLRLSNNNFFYIFVTIFALWAIGALLSFPMKELYHPDDTKPAINFSALISRTDVVIVAFMGIIFGIGMSAVFTFIAPYMYNYNLGKTSTFMVPYTAAAILSRLLFGRYADRSRNALLIPGFAIMTAGQILVGGVNAAHLLPWVGFFLGIAHGLVFPAMVATMLDRVGPDNRGRGMGLINAATDLGSLAGATGLGLVAESLNFPTMYRVSDIAIGTGFLLYFIGRCIIDRKRNTAGEP